MGEKFSTAHYVLQDLIVNLHIALREVKEDSEKIVMIQDCLNKLVEAEIVLERLADDRD